MAENTAIFVGGVASANEEERGRDLARRYRCEFVDLKAFHLQQDLFRKIPVELMFRYNFVPLEELADGKLAIAIADPTINWRPSFWPRKIRPNSALGISSIANTTDTRPEVTCCSAR